MASAVSKRVTALEVQLGVTLLRRGPRGMLATEAGELFARQAREVLALMERMQLMMNDIASGSGGSVRILASLAALSNQLPSDLVRILQRHRSIKVSLRECATTEIVRQVREGTADLGVCWDAADLSDLTALPYRPDHACLLVNRGHPLSRRKAVQFEEALAYEFISAMPGSMMEIMLRRHAAVAGKTMSSRIEVHSFDGVCRIVAAGLGVSVLPREVVSAQAQALGLRLIPLADAWARRQMVICSRSEPYLSASVRLVADGLAIN